MSETVTCHCGQLQVHVPALPAPETLNRCACSICTRLGAAWAYFDPKDVQITGPVARYIWGDRTLAFLHCPECGVTVAWVPIVGPWGRMGVNVYWG